MKTHFQITLILFSIINFWVISSCGKVQTEIPSYLKVNTAGLSDSSFGVNTSNIYGLNFQVGNDNRGRWQLPFSSPVLKFGINQTYIEPMVKFNNLSTSFVVYPLYQPLKIYLDFQSQKTIDTNLNFKYYPDVALIFYEDNEVSDKFTNSEITTSQSIYGKYCLKMDATVNTNDSNNISTYYKPLPLNAQKETYLEFDYYMPEGVLAPVLLFDDPSGTRVIYSINYLLPNKNWTHVYWYLSPTVRKYGQSQYTLAFELTPETGKQTAVSYMDNIKILEK